MSEMLQAALSYAERGWFVFPLHNIENGRCSCRTNCGSPGKHPRTKNGLKDATIDAAQIESWWTRWTEANIGIATGSVSGIYVIDIDNKRSVEVAPGILISEGEASLRQQAQVSGELPATLTSLTGSGGTHLVFGYPTIPMETVSFGNRAGILPSVDTRGDGGYIVAPPSLHLSGNRYQWQDSDLPISSLPKSWIDFVQATTGLSSNMSLQPGEGKIRPGEGQHEWLFKQAAKLRGQHALDPIAMKGAILAYNREYLDPPLDEPAYIDHVVAQAMKYEPGLPPKPVDTSWPELHAGDARAEPFIHFMNHEPEPFKELVAGILHSGECMILGGQPNIGKSWLIMDMMLGIAEGGHFANHFSCSQGNVLFIDEEGSRRGNWERFQMLLQGRDRSSVELPIWSKIGAGIRIDSERGHATLSRLLDQHRPSAVFLDSLVRLHGGDESNNRSMAQFFDLIKPLMLAYSTSFVFTHHVPKPPAQGKQDPVFMLRGASDIQGFPDSILVATPGQDTAEVRITHTKMRNGPKLSPFYVRMQIDQDDGVAQLGYIMEPYSVSHTNTRDKILEKLASGIATPLSLSYMTGLSELTVKEHLKALAADGAVRESGGWFQLAIGGDA